MGVVRWAISTLWISPQQVVGRQVIYTLNVVSLFMTLETMGADSIALWLSAQCTLSITHCLRLNLQLHTIDLVRTWRISSFCTVALQLARFQLTRRLARSLGDSWASCCIYNMCMNFVHSCVWQLFLKNKRRDEIRHPLKSAPLLRTRDCHPVFADA